MGRRRKKRKSSGGLWEDAEAANNAAYLEIMAAKIQTGNLSAQDIADLAEIDEAFAGKEAMEQTWVNGVLQKSSFKPVQPPITGYSGGYLGTGGVYTPTPYATCDHSGMKPEIELDDGKITLAGARGAQVKNWPDNTSLIIDCAGMVSFPQPRNYALWFKRGPAELVAKLMPPPGPPPKTPPPLIELAWADRREPDVDVEWWSQLLRVIRAEYVGHIIVACVGGHGRTGTALSALILAAYPKWGVEQTIKFVRENHCKKSVESDDQVEYLLQFRPNEWSDWLDTEINGPYKKPATTAGSTVAK